jgi:U3 small nucleolar RNA-associated protein 23
VQSSAFASVEQPRKIRKGPKGPNPLSVKKKAANVLSPSKKHSKPKKTEPSPKSHTNDVKAGMKRKRSPNDESADDVLDGNAGGQSIKKRRRKRKSKAQVITDAG